MSGTEAQFTPTQIYAAGLRAEHEGRIDHARQFYRHLVVHAAHAPEAAMARQGLLRLGEQVEDPLASQHAVQDLGVRGPTQPASEPFVPPRRADPTFAVDERFENPTQSAAGPVTRAVADGRQTPATRAQENSSDTRQLDTRERGLRPAGRALRQSSSSFADEASAPRKKYLAGRLVASLMLLAGGFAIVGGFALVVVGVSGLGGSVPLPLPGGAAAFSGAVMFGLGAGLVLIAQIAQAIFDGSNAVQSGQQRH